MANITMTQLHEATPGSVQEGASFKREVKVTYDDIVNGGTYSDNDTGTLAAIPVFAGEFVEHAAVTLVTAFDDSGSGDELNIEVGDGSTANGYCTTAAIHTDQTEITYVANTGAYVVGGSAARGKLYTANDTIDLKFTPNVSTGTDYNLGELTAGELVVTIYGKSFI
jgi:hypothetical protein